MLNPWLDAPTLLNPSTAIGIFKKTSHRLLLTLLVASCFMFCGCGVSMDYGQLNNMIKSGDCDAARNFMSESFSEYGDNARLVYLLDQAVMEFKCGDYTRSAALLQQAEDLSNELYATSISREAASYLTNDYVLEYDGEDFERALIHLFSALNYLMMEKYDDALVDCRRLDALLVSYNDQYETKNIYKEDAFGRYLSGTLYERDQQLDDAFLDYLKSYRAYQSYQQNYGTPPPPSLIDDLMILGKKLHRMDEVRSLMGASYLSKIPKIKSTTGSIVVIGFNGASPVKRDDRFTVMTKQGPITIAFPVYMPQSSPCQFIRVNAASDKKTVSAKAFLAENITAIAVKDLEDRKTRDMAKAIARAIAKQIAFEQMSHTADKSEHQDLIKIGLNFANLVIEQADTRSWRTLPAEIYMTRVRVPAGIYNVTIDRCGGSQVLASESLNVRPGDIRYVIDHSYTH